MADEQYCEQQAARRSQSAGEVSHSAAPGGKPSFLEVPAHRPRRPSLDSTYSELSELSLYSDELRHGRPLMPSSSALAADHQPSRGQSLSRSSAPPPRRGWRRHVYSFWTQNFGVFLVLLAMCFGSGMNVGTRLLETPGPHGTPMHPFQILFARQSITAACCCVYGFATERIPHFPLGPKEVRWLLVTRGLTGFFGVFGLYFSLLYLPLSEATVLTFLSPILTCYACSWWIPGESFTKQQQLAGLVSLVGVIFIAQPASLFAASDSPSLNSPSAAVNSTSLDASSAAPMSTFFIRADSTAGPVPPTPHQHLLAIGVAMLGVLGAAGAMTSIRAIGTRAHPLVSINYFSIWCSLVSLFAVFFVPGVGFRLPANVLEWSILVGIGVCGFTMQWLLTAGLAYGTPEPGTKRLANSTGSSRRSVPAKKGSGTRATSMVYTQMLFALTWDKLIFDVTPGAMSWVGSVLILAGAIWVAAARDQRVKDGAGASAVQTEANVAVVVEEASGQVYHAPRQGKAKQSSRPEEGEEESLMRTFDAQDSSSRRASKEGDLELQNLGLRREKSHESV